MEGAGGVPWGYPARPLGGPAKEKSPLKSLDGYILGAVGSQNGNLTIRSQLYGSVKAKQKDERSAQLSILCCGDGCILCRRLPDGDLRLQANASALKSKNRDNQFGEIGRASCR